MKKLLSSAFAVTILFGWLFAVSSASAHSDCKEVEFNDGTVCVSIEKVRTDRFELITEKEDSSVGALRCDIMLPDSTLKSIASCNAEFTFDDSRSGRIKLRIRADNEAPKDWEDKPNSSSIRTYPQWMYDFSNEEWMDSNLSDSNDNNNDNADNFSITASPSSPSENEDVDVTIKARDGSSTDTSYRGTVRFKVEKKSGSSSWTTASSNYYDLSRTSYTFTSSDDGEHEFSNLVSFNNDAYDYRLVVTDSSNDIVGYKIFYLNGSYEDQGPVADNFYITASPTDPEEDEFVDITVKARNGSSTDDSYRGTVRFKVERKSGSSWVSATSTYYTLARTSYTFTSSDDGEHDFSNLVRFRNDAYDYRLVVYDDDDDDIDGYKIFYLNGSNNDNNGDLDNFYLTTNDTTPTTSQYVNLTIEARDSNDDTVTDYTDLVNFKIYKRASGSSTWTLTTSSTDFEIDSDYEDGYDFTSSDDGDVTLNNFIKFKRNNYSYKVRVYAEDDTSIYKEITFTVGSVNNDDYSTDNFYVTTDDTTPSTTQRVDLRVKARDGTSTDTEYDGDIVVTVYYRTSSSASWTKTTSSSYFEINSTYDDDYDNGIAFASSRNGYHVFTDFIKLKKNYEYKVVVEDADDSNIDGYIYFNSSNYDDNDSSVDGFSTSELATVQSMYNSRPNLIRDLKAQYSKLRNSTTWINRSDTFYHDMNDILDDATNKTYDTYDEYYAGFLSRYRYTISIR